MLQGGAGVGRVGEGALVQGCCNACLLVAARPPAHGCSPCAHPGPPPSPLPPGPDEVDAVAAVNAYAKELELLPTIHGSSEVEVDTGGGRPRHSCFRVF